MYSEDDEDYLEESIEIGRSDEKREVVVHGDDFRDGVFLHVTTGRREEGEVYIFYDW